MTSRVSGQLPQRQATVSRNRLLHVGDLLTRNSMTRAHNLPPLATVLDNSPAHPQEAAAGTGAGTGVARGGSYMGPVATVAAASPVMTSSSKAVHATPTANGLQPAAAAVSADGVRVEVAGPATPPSSLSAAVAAVLQQPAPAGAYVVRDIKISRLAGELDTQL